MTSEQRLMTGATLTANSLLDLFEPLSHTFKVTIADLIRGNHSVFRS